MTSVDDEFFREVEYLLSQSDVEAFQFIEKHKSQLNSSNNANIHMLFINYLCDHATIFQDKMQLLHLIHDFAIVENNLKSLIPQLKAMCDKSKSLKAYLLLLKVVHNLFDHLGIDNLDSILLKELVRMQFECLSKIHSFENKKYIFKTNAKLKRLVAKYLPLYMNYILGSDCDTISLQNCFGIKLVVECVLQNKDHENKYKPDLLNLFSKVILTSKTGDISKEMLDSFVPLIRIFSQEDFNSNMKEHITKCLKFSLEQKLYIVAFVVSAIKLDMSKYAVEVFSESIIKALLSSKEKVRADGHLLLSCLSATCGDFDVICQLIDLFSDTLNGKGTGGKQAVSQTYQRKALVEALECIVSSVEPNEFFKADHILSNGIAYPTSEVISAVISKSNAKILASKMVSILCEYLKKETHDDTKNTILLATARWINSGQLDELPSNVAEILNKQLVSVKKDSPTDFYLKMLELLVRVVPLRDSLVNCMLESEPKEISVKLEKLDTVSKSKSKKSKASVEDDKPSSWSKVTSKGIVSCCFSFIQDCQFNSVIKANEATAAQTNAINSLAILLTLSKSSSKFYSYVKQLQDKTNFELFDLFRKKDSFFHIYTNLFSYNNRSLAGITIPSYHQLEGSALLNSNSSWLRAGIGVNEIDTQQITLCHLIHVVCDDFYSEIELKKKALHPVMVSTVILLNSKSINIRNLIFKFFNKLELDSEHVLTALIHYINHYKSSVLEENEDQFQVPSQQVLQQILFACISKHNFAAVSNANVLPLILAVCYHPYVTVEASNNSQATRTAWNRIANAYMKQNNILNAKQAVSSGVFLLKHFINSDETLSSVTQLLFNKSEYNMYSTEFPLYRTALSKVLALLLGCMDSNFSNQLMNSFLDSVTNKYLGLQLEQVSEKDLAIYHTPKDELCTFGEETGGDSNETNSSKPAVKTKKHLNDTEAWEKKIKMELKAKKSGKKDKDKKSDAKADAKELKSKLKEQNTVRKHVQLIVDMINVLHGIICNLCHPHIDGNASLNKHIRAVVNTIVPKLLPMLQNSLLSDLTVDKTFDIVKELISTDLNLNPYRMELTTCYLQVLRVFIQTLELKSIDMDALINLSEGKIQKVLNIYNSQHASTMEYLISHVFELLGGLDDAFDALNPSLGNTKILSYNCFLPLSQIVNYSIIVNCFNITLSESQVETNNTVDDDDESTEDLTSMDIIEYGLSITSVNLELLANHSSLRRSTLVTVLKIISIIPSCTPPPSNVLEKICKLNELSPGDLLPLLNDHGVLSDDVNVRKAVLGAFHSYLKQYNTLNIEENPLLLSRIWFACNDSNESISELAEEIIDLSDVEMPENFMDLYLPLLGHEHESVRFQVAKAVAFGVDEHPEMAKSILKVLVAEYNKSLSRVQEEITQLTTNKRPMFVERGSKAMTDDERIAMIDWRVRGTVALSYQRLGNLEEPGSKEPAAGVLENEQVLECFEFILEFGLRDPNPTVRQYWLSAGNAFIQSYGQEMQTKMLPTLNPYLEVNRKKLSKQLGYASTQLESDWQREGAVVYLGGLAAYLERDNPQIPQIIDTLIEALRTPSESVQLAVVKCLPPLMKIPSIKQQAGSFLELILARATSTKSSYGERRGAAFGLAGMVKGFGISSLKQHSIVTQLESIAKTPDTKKVETWEARQGAIFCFEALCSTLGMLFEPYVIVILPVLLKAYADNKQDVREAAQSASRVVMAKLSAHGVKLVLPSLLTAIRDPAWRTKQAAVQLLGAMAYCAPKQLASCLPQIVPRLIEAFTDTHAKVRVAGDVALKDVGSVIRNPEIQQLVPMMMNALTNPHEKTRSAVDTLHKTRFIHMVDAPSLALMVPILHRGLNERSTDTKKKAALIVGNMCSMISDPKAVQPYVEGLLPVLRKVLVDPIPGVRSTAAKALGTLTRGLGESLPSFNDLLEWLIETMKGDTSAVERSGGAQGLIEVLAALGDERLKGVLDSDVWPLAADSHAYVREGCLWCIVYLPSILGSAGNEPYITSELPIVIKSLADESEPVRDAALRAGEVIVSLHAISHTSKLLPALQSGLVDFNWRIRQYSIHLLGDLMYQVGGAKVVVLDDEDEDDETINNSSFNHIDTKIMNTLGADNRNTILASLYMMRTDSSAVVRQSALQVWKQVVVNTPRTLRQILPFLLSSVVTGLSSSSNDRRGVASRCLGELVRKLGDVVLPEIIPIIEMKLKSDHQSERSGVCFGLIEIIEAATKTQLEEYLEVLLPAVQQALCDELPKVREAAAQAFNKLRQSVGRKAVDDIVPTLLRALEKGDDSEEGALALEGLRQILVIRSREVMPFLLPKLLISPISIFHSKALSAVVEVVGPNLHFYLSTILPFLIDEIAMSDAGIEGVKAEDSNEAERIEYLWQASVATVLNVHDAGLSKMLDIMLPLFSSDEAKTRRAVGSLLRQFLKDSDVDYDDSLDMIIKEVLKHFADPDTLTLKEAWQCMNAITAANEVDDLVEHLDFLRREIRSAASISKHRKVDGRAAGDNFEFPALCLPKGLGPFLPVYQHALMHGSPDERENAAYGLGELIDLTSSAALKPFIIKITGPLIRIVGDRFTWQVKVAILDTLNKLLIKGGIVLRPFLPQLQTTFVKALNNESSQVRSKGTKALSLLMSLSTRVDPLVTELTNGAILEDSIPGIKQTMLEALKCVLVQCGSKINAAVIEKSMVKLPILLSSDDEGIRKAAAKVIGECMSLVASETILNEFLINKINDIDSFTKLNWDDRHGTALLLCYSLLKVPTHVLTAQADLIDIVETIAKDDKLQIKQSCAGSLVALLILSEQETTNALVSNKQVKQLIKIYITLLNDESIDVRIEAFKWLKFYYQNAPKSFLPFISDLVQPLIHNIKNYNASLKFIVDGCFINIFDLKSTDLNGLASNTNLKSISNSDLNKNVSEYCKKLIINTKLLEEQTLDIDANL